ncbi:hypothetical protein SAMN02745124_00820 [Desulfofustis glycolicus DSM 9705]|uniref:Uncharacterized protein n=1 Tax=Desulfofustis glycolicus DSM 9705 TaxID=1121409 RepID=A0A1M5TN26_9BACT|nr:hypothetical protein SAMN02745124_00820 [Desulfofustis glycolicus DSM 9705]
MDSRRRKDELTEKAAADPLSSERRTAVKTIVSGISALTAYHLMPVDWSRPIVEQVLLPAHAAASGFLLHDPCSIQLLSGTNSSSSVSIRVSGFVSPPFGGLAVQITATPSGAGSPVSGASVTAADGTFSVIIDFTSSPGIQSISVVTSVAGASGAASCSITVPAGSTTTPTPSTTPS